VGACACLSSLLAVGRHEELHELLSLLSYRFWPFDRFKAESLVRQGRTEEALRYVEAFRKKAYNVNSPAIDAFCERVLLEAGRREEAYTRYGLTTSVATTNLATFRNVRKKYPERDPEQILLDLIAAQGVPGKWFAAAKDAGFLELALQCARDPSAEPATLIRAARDFADREPEFAAKASLRAIEHLLSGRGYEPTPLVMQLACQHLTKAAANCGLADWAMDEVNRLVAEGVAPGGKLMLVALNAAMGRRPPDG